MKNSEAGTKPGRDRQGVARAMAAALALALCLHAVTHQPAVERIRPAVGWRGEMEEVTTESSAPSGDARDKRFWTPEREEVLRRGLPDEPNAKGKAINKLRALHPKLKKLNTIQKRLDETAPRA